MSAATTFARRGVASTLASLLLLGSGCALTRPAAPIDRPLPTELQLGRLSERTAFEDAGASQAPTDDAPAATDDATFAGDADTSTRDDDKQGARTGAFIAGIIIASVGTAGTIAFSAGGQATQNKLGDGYDSSLTRAEEQKLNDRGAVLNRLSIGSAAVGVVGLGLAMVALGLDYTKCGKIVKKRHKRCKRE